MSKTKELNKNGESKKPYVFISYSSKDKAKVSVIVKALKKNNIEIWIDEKLQDGYGGLTWSVGAIDAINSDNCKAVLFFLSINSLRSYAVLGELKYAEMKNKRIIPIWLESGDPCSLNSFIKKIYENSKNNNDKLSDNEINKLIEMMDYFDFPQHLVRTIPINTTHKKISKTISDVIGNVTIIQINKIIPNVKKCLNLLTDDCMCGDYDIDLNICEIEGLDIYTPNGGKNDYEKENIRLRKQSEFLKYHTNDVFKKFVKISRKYNILDIGSGNGDYLRDRIDEINIRYYVGVDIREKIVEEANRKYGKGNSIGYYPFDVREEDFFIFLDEERFLDEEDKKNKKFDGFDIINISFLALHLDNHLEGDSFDNFSKLLKRIKKYLKPDGTIIIVDVIDDFNFACPDDDNLFSDFFKINSINPLGGNRNKGKEIYSDLIQAGFESKNIILQKSCFSTINVPVCERKNFWDLYFQFVYNDFEELLPIKGNITGFDDKGKKVPLYKYSGIKGSFDDDYIWLSLVKNRLKSRVADPAVNLCLGISITTVQGGTYVLNKKGD